MLGRASEIKQNDQWLYHGETYTVERNEEGELYFKHPSESAGEDDHILINKFMIGEIIFKEES